MLSIWYQEDLAYVIIRSRDFTKGQRIYNYKIQRSRYCNREEARWIGKAGKSATGG
jgi:hypothetical protein